MSDFGDWESDDAYADEPLDAEQTARYMHELRAYLAVMAGDELEAFDALPLGDQAVARSLGRKLVEALESDTDDTPMQFHEAVAFYSQDPEWSQLSPEAQEVATGLIDDILAWARRQGAIS